MCSVMKKIILPALLIFSSISLCFGKNYDITEEAEAFAEAEKSGKAVAYLFTGNASG